MADEELDNPRDVELESLEAIYPEIQKPKPDDPYTIALDVPVAPSKEVIVFFPAASDDGTGPAAPQRSAPQREVDSHEIAHLPSIHLKISFGAKYPADEPPKVAISTDPPWLPVDTIKRLEEDGPRLWEDIGRDIVGFTYIDHLHQAAEDVFGLVGEKNALEVNPQHKIAILDYDIQARRAAFEKGTFECGVCLDPKKGSACHQMLDCGHVFCIECLQDFYNNAIKEGDLAAVRCLAPNCTRDREKAASSASGKKKKPKIFISPSELLQIPLDQDTVKRYVTLKYKTELESDKNTVYCPRQWCNGAARSKKHKKPRGLELAENSDDSASDDDEDEGHIEGEGKSKPYKAAAELLSICEECSFAFCSRCLQSWHGEFVRCTPRREKEELTAEELASLEYMKLHTTPCPTCAAPAQKTHGCNHMICYRCQTHFCYLCSAWLDPGNPYQHFNTMPDGRVTSCYMRLWELELGDGDDVGYGFAGGAGQAPHPVVAAVPMQDLIPEIEEPSDEEEEGPPAPAAPARPHEAQAHGGQVGIAREGPLVLRIAANQPAGAGRGGPRGRAAPGPAPRPVRGGRGQQAVRGGAQVQGGGRGGAGAQRGGRQARAGAAAAQRGGGRGGGGGGVGGVGGPLPHHRQNNNNQANQAQQRRNVNNDPNQNQNGGVPGGGGEFVEVGELRGGQNELDPAQEAWVRHFVQLALNDEEDILFEDDFSDDD
ncbi:hypothetical protein QBC42DRAFT_1640 [Cladorrhinum samala]|uniref:RBR-type E3 ubiquitin transferase n=1 Tax=Cladorrhinum samala TaxID=585594 RepID=A0AAV9I5S9_9PEZI|nr:hypothetical protein QBC42DRAFT_1640 [Cladorrhinum samala]